MLSVGTVVMGVEDFSRAVAFWTQALGYVPKRDITPDDDYMILVPATGSGTHLALDVSQSPIQEHPRIHLDLYAGDAADQAAEVERLLSLGASAGPPRPLLRRFPAHYAKTSGGTLGKSIPGIPLSNPSEPLQIGMRTFSVSSRLPSNHRPDRTNLGLVEGSDSRSP